MKHSRIILAAILFISSAAFAQVITTFAGGGSTTSDGALAVNTSIAASGIALDAAGNVFVAASEEHKVYKIDAATGVMHLLRTWSDNLRPFVMKVDATGALYVSLEGSIEVVDATTGATLSSRGLGGLVARDFEVDGTTVWVVRGGGFGFFGDVVRLDASGAVIATLDPPADPWAPTTIARDAAGNLYVGDERGHRVFKYLGAAGSPILVAGTGTAGFSGDGAAATLAALNVPRGLAVDAAGNLFISDWNNQRIRRVAAADGTIETVAGGGSGVDGPALSVALFQVTKLAVSGSAVYFFDSRVRKLEGGSVATIAGGMGDGGLATAAILGNPGSIAFDASGNAFFQDGGALRRIDASTAIISTVTNGGGSLAFDSAGNLYRGSGGQVDKIDPVSGARTRFAGLVGRPDGGDGGPAIDAGLTLDDGLLAIGGGNLYIGGRYVRKVDLATGIITTVAGRGSNFNPTDGTPAIDAGNLAITSLAADSAGNLFFATWYSVYRVAAGTGLLTRLLTVLGGGPPYFVRISSVVVDAAGNVYVASGGNTVQRIGTDGRITTVAGNGHAGTMVEGAFANTTSIGPPLTPIPPALSRNASTPPEQLAIGKGGHLYISATPMKRVLRVTFEGLATSPPLLSFSSQPPGVPSLPSDVVITQLGPSAAAIGSVTVPANFSLTHDCPPSLASGASCVASVTFTPPATGVYTGALDITAPGVVQDGALFGASENGLVFHYYDAILGRSPDASGKVFWDAERQRMAGLGANVNETWFAMSSFFFASAEYAAFNRDAAGFTNDLYRTFFNRAPDSSGQQFWIDQLAAGMPREVVLAEFQHSAEFKAFTEGLFGNTAARAEIDMVMDFYRGLLGRLPDNAGFATWVNAMRTAQCQGAQAVVQVAANMAASFAASPEYANRSRTNGQYVGDLYNAFLRRGGDLTGVQYWIGYLGTHPRAEVREAFFTSPEFSARLNNVIAQGCLP